VKKLIFSFLLTFIIFAQSNALPLSAILAEQRPPGEKQQFLSNPLVQPPIETVQSPKDTQNYMQAYGSCQETICQAQKGHDQILQLHQMFMNSLKVHRDKYSCPKSRTNKLLKNMLNKLELLMLYNLQISTYLKSQLSNPTLLTGTDNVAPLMEAINKATSLRNIVHQDIFNLQQQIEKKEELRHKVQTIVLQN